MKQHPLKVERELRGWSQAKVAEALNTTVRTVSRWEQGQTLPYPFYREQLCQLFGKDARHLGLLPEREDVETCKDCGLSLSACTCPPAEDPLAPQIPSQAALPYPPSGASPTFGASPKATYDPTIPEALGSASGLLGREHLLRQAKQCLFEKKRLALCGLPGIGKTALTIALATDPQAQERFQDGILWAGLGPQPDILGLLVRWGKLLGITPGEVENASSQQDWRRALQAAIGQRCLLLVIDDAWSINDALALQVGGAECAYLLTTRQPQVAFAFAQEKTITIHELAEADGLALLARFVPQLVQQEVEEARALVHEVSGLPLALMLMGKYLAAHFLPGQPHRIQRALAQLHQATQRLQISPSDRSLSNLALDVPLSLYAAIAISDQRLSLLAHRALCALSVFPAKPDSFTEEAALAVVGTVPCASLEPIEILDELWDAGLLESNGPGRYCLHQTIVNYAQTQVENSEAEQRLVYYIVAYVTEHQQDYEMLEREANILWVAMDTASRLEMWPDLVRGGVALVPFMYVRGLYRQADLLLQQVLHATLQLEDQLASTIVLYHLADFADLLGDYAHVEAYGRQGLELARRLDQQGLESGFLYVLGNMWRRRGDYAQAKRLLEDGLYLARLLNDLERICHLLSGLGTVLRHQGNYSQAHAYYAEALALARQTESQELVSRQLASVSVLEQEQGNYAQAEAYCKEGMQLAWQVGYQEQLCFHLNTLGLIAVQQRAYSQAEAYYQEALAQARRIGHRAHICTLLTNLGYLSELRGDYIQVERYCQEGVELARQMGLRHRLVALLPHLGYAVGQQGGTYQRANTYFQECLQIVQQLRRNSVLHLSRLIDAMYIFWGEIHLKYQYLDAATSAFAEVLQSARESEQAQGKEVSEGPTSREQDPGLRALAQYGLARIATLHGAITEAHRLGEECAMALEKLGHCKASEVRQWLATVSVCP
jgi:tetratricopeptide (TPR) repeat protein/transcriptional regulator with XRE-family HTH domain